ncbi:MAG: recombination protein RecR [Bacteroidetes bacterium]|nr:MAG: recombination protein RecR [Bacteroidota bacterium]
MNNISSKLLDSAVNELSKLPGIGKKTALRLAIHLLRRDEEDVERLGISLIKMRNDIQFCRRCHNISDNELCEICNSPKREHTTICVVENINDVIAIENTGQYQGAYHVLGGIIAPMEGIGPADLNIESLFQRIQDTEINEVIMALPTTVEGDTTNFYIYRNLSKTLDKITTISRGVSIGDELEYTDEITLGRSILNRLPYEDYMNK